MTGQKKKFSRFITIRKWSELQSKFTKEECLKGQSTNKNKLLKRFLLWDQWETFNCDKGGYLSSVEAPI